MSIQYTCTFFLLSLIRTQFPIPRVDIILSFCVHFVSILYTYLNPSCSFFRTQFPLTGASFNHLFCVHFVSILYTRLNLSFSSLRTQIPITGGPFTNIACIKKRKIRFVDSYLQQGISSSFFPFNFFLPPTRPLLTLCRRLSRGEAFFFSPTAVALLLLSHRRQVLDFDLAVALHQLLEELEFLSSD